MDHTDRQNPSAQLWEFQSPATRDHKAQNSAAMDKSQRSPPTQTQPGPLMKCCQKTNIRDCDCLVPEGPCKVPVILVNHYTDDCDCYACQWIQEARKKEIPNRLQPESSGTVVNPTYAGDNLDKVYYSQTTDSSFSNIELVYPLLVQEGPQRWGWVLQPTKLKKITELPYLADRSQCPRFVERVTLGSDGQWKVILAKQKSSRLVHNTVPLLNELYSGYGFHPTCSPYPAGCTSDNPRHPHEVNPPCYVPQRPATRPHQWAAERENTTMFVGGINGTVSDEDIRYLFGNFGQVRYINRPCKSNAFVQYALRRDALMAMRQMQGVPVHSCRLRISWGQPFVKNQDEISAKNGPIPYKGHRHQRSQQPEQVQDGHPHQGFKNMSQPWSQQQQYQMPPHQYHMLQQQNHMQQMQLQQQQHHQMQLQQQQYQMQLQQNHMPQIPYAPDAGIIGYYVEGERTGQRMVRGGQPLAHQPPPPPPSQSTAPSHQPASPQKAHTSGAFKLNPSAASWKGNLKGKGPVVVSSDMVPSASQQPGHQQSQDDTPSSPEGHQTGGSTGDSQSPASTGKTSPEKGDSPEKWTSP